MSEKLSTASRDTLPSQPEAGSSIDVQPSPGEVSNLSEGEGQSAQFEAWKQPRETQASAERVKFEAWQEERDIKRVEQTEADQAIAEAYRQTEKPTRREVTPQEKIEAESRRTQQAERQAERLKSINLQLDTEELHAKLGKPGLSRLLHPFRNARILLTVAKRAWSGQYDPRLKSMYSNGLRRTPDGLLDPFSEAEDPLAQARLRRERQKHEAEEQAMLAHPFEE